MRAWPIGEAEVQVTLTPSGEQTEVAIHEDVVSGPGVLVPGLVRQPALMWRNSEALRRLRLRLRLLVEGRAGRTACG